MQPDPRSHLHDCLEAITRLQNILQNTSESGFLKDWQKQWTVERGFEIVGESLNRLRRDHPSLALQLPDLPRIIGLRNIIAHGYDSINHQQMWLILQEKLIPLKNSVDRLLASLS